MHKARIAASNRNLSLKVLHAYKGYRPEVEGGIPEVIANLTTEEPPEQKSSILVARERGLPRNYAIDGVPVTASGSFGTLLSMPLAPGYPLSFSVRSSRADLVVHHAPFPLNDIAIAAMRSRTALI